MSNLEQAAKQLLEHWDTPLWKQTEMTGTYINALRKAVDEQAEQEPVAWMVTMENQDGTRKTFPLSGRYKDVRDACDFGDPIPLYTHPVRTVDLTDDEIADIVYEMNGNEPTAPFWRDLARAVIAAYKAKNNGVD